MTMTPELKKHMIKRENHDYNFLFSNLFYKKKTGNGKLYHCIFSKKDGEWNNFQHEDVDVLISKFDDYFEDVVKSYKDAK